MSEKTREQLEEELSQARSVLESDRIRAEIIRRFESKQPR